MKFARSVATSERTLTPRGGGPAIALAADEVARQRVQLVAIDRAGVAAPYVTPFARLSALLRAGDLVVLNDAATLPGSLRGASAAGDGFELRLSAPVDGTRIFGVLLGAGDYRTRTEDRGAPPCVRAGDAVTIAELPARVAAVAGRRVELCVLASPERVWRAIYATGAPVQYAHRAAPLPLYDVQTAYAARPWAAEMPSAGRPLTWDVLLGLRRAGVAFATLTHAAGLSSTGDAALDRALPWPERYEIPERTSAAIAAARARGGRVIAVGTTVVRALESAPAAADGVTIAAGAGTATLRIDAAYRPRIVDGLVSGLHVPGESHFELLSAFAPPDVLARAMALAAARGLSAHELGDACLVL